VAQGTVRQLEVKREWLGAVAPFVEHYRRAFVVLFLALVACAATAQSAQKLFWWDELASYDVALLPHASDVWKFYRAGLDAPSPFPTLLVQLTMHWIGKSEVLVRAPFEAGFLLMCLCLYGITSRRYGSGYALSALLLPALSGTFYFATELRPYAIVLGTVSFAFYCWQSIREQGMVRLLGILGVFAGLATAILLHTFSLFVLPPFVLAQTVRDWRARRVDIPIWAALVLAPICLLIELPGMQAAHKIYANVFWSKPEPRQILGSYIFSVEIGWMIAVILVLMACTVLRDRYPAFEAQSSDRGFDLAEWVFIATIALLPLYAWPLSHFVGVFVSRYVISLTIGVVLLVVAGVAETLKRNRLGGVVLSLALLLVFVQDKHSMMAEALRSHETPTAALQEQPWIQELQKSSLPVITPYTTVYVGLQHYVSPTLERRLYYTLNNPPGIRLDEAPVAALSMRLFATHLPLQVEEFSTFANQHPSFLILTDTPLALTEDTGNLLVHLIGNYRAERRFGMGYFYIYQASVTGNSNHAGDRPAIPVAPCK
jgi:Dolichyl-phosphate-mannose-protein mannosyltransferase